MRLSLISVLLLAAACGDNSNNNGSDMSAASDMTMMVSADLSVPQTCFGVISCIQKCADAPCVNACVATGTPSAKTKYQALIACGFTQCVVVVDGGAAQCGSASDTSPLCVSCVAAAAQSSACSTELTDCITDS